ncbi:MAG: virulence RhuM family protein [Deltaproteobacteria bacterium]|nr:virulence RhuM family protein [Deltaproteobacteria bacterium]
MTHTTGELLLYESEDGTTRLHVRLVDGDIWLTQALMADLYGKDVRTISEHLGNIYAEGELDRAATIRKFRIVRTEGNRDVSRDVDHYDLRAILAVGYRVRSPQGTRFRQWATSILREYAVKGFAMDDARLAEPGGVDYFDELLERIRAIRASERRFYQKITDIYARCSVDYDKNAEITRTFYATVQNKLHFAVHGQTAAELIVARADDAQPHMGLNTWKAGPGGPIRKADVGVAKNYLSADELRELERIVTMYLDYAEDQARRRNPMTMAEWVERLDLFLRFNDREVLADAGKVSHALAAARAQEVYERYDENRSADEARVVSSDFDEMVARRLGREPEGGER